MRNSGSGWGIDWLPDDMARTSRESDGVQLVDRDLFALFFIVDIGQFETYFIGFTLAEFYARRLIDEVNSSIWWGLDSRFAIASPAWPFSAI